MAEAKDWQLEAPASLKDIVRDELIASNYDDFRRHKEVKPITDETVDELMKRVYGHIEKQALELYHSSEPWALRQWALANILKDEVVNETSNQIAHELISPVIEWQGESYDPVARYKQKLIADGKPEHSIAVLLMAVVRFVGRKGRKRSYSDEDIIEHISYLRQNGYIKKQLDHKTGQVVWKQVPYKPSSIYNEVVRLKSFFQFLHGRNWSMPVKMPPMPDREELCQPMLSDEEVEALIFSTVIDHVPANWVVRLAASTLYGCRASELGDIESKYIHLDGEGSSIYICTRKKGIRKSQPIPQSLLPLFAVSVEPMKEWGIQYAFRSMCKKAEIELPPRAGWHSLRRRVVTDVYSKTTAKEMPIINYFRWSTKQRHLSQLPTYVKVPTDVTDREILSQHPLVKTWETVVPYLVKLHPEYSSNLRVNKLYNENVSF